MSHTQPAQPNPDAKLRIAEVFASIQGEGVWAGTPSTFIRVSGCNLRCRWCDTPYASWSPEGATWEVGRLIEELFPLDTKHVVITGGEPMLFEGTVALAEACGAHEHIVTIETAGTVYQDVRCDLMSISPKLGNSTPDTPEWHDRHEATRGNLEPLRQLMERYPFQLKFVVNPEEGDDLGEIDALLERLPKVDGSQILLMPEGRDQATLWRRARMLIPTCMSRNWRLAPRLQIDLFGDTRGT